MIQLAIVEDEDAYAKQLTEYTDKYQKESGQYFKITRFRDGDEITNGYRGQFDIILMDIEMKLMDGMTAAEEIRKLDQDVVIMFITNMTNYAIRGYQVDALDYVLKPVSYFAFSQKLGRAIGRLNKKSNNIISIDMPSGVKKLDIDNIFYIESEGHNLNFYTSGGEFTIRAKLKDFDEQLSKHGFFRSNKGYLVNLKYVDGVENGSCIIAGKQLLISRARKSDFMSALTDYMASLS
ncbi:MULTISPECIES: LytR/AlgR family response regulator transcription factor [unclassified Butyrivibrio]|uniref:LytR/AlgR family response regulator transcription factor n=1 Tax=unclassified Butyrivibrio TaxID=2639466 RepID=UPI0008DFB468|nr:MULTISPECIES: LytTR family DNA-binding domain-containing protein [unclassified Butyrivibrio]RKM63169.1 DNA-binding response regulator [Butyrivibrio sp. XB500-5]SFU69671.1 two component transcriptional regulator, LytTR family [Butyrivibrio sp. INlla21]